MEAPVVNATAPIDHVLVVYPWTTIATVSSPFTSTSRVTQMLPIAEPFFFLPLPGYAASLDYYASALDRITKLQATFAPLFQDATQDLLKGMRQVRDSSFDLNVVLSRWADDNPNLPLDYDTLTWLATLFGWNSACNLTDYLANPDDLPRLEEFMREQLPPPPNSADPAPASMPRSAKSSPQASPVVSIPGPPDPQPLSRRRPAAAVPSNFHPSPSRRPVSTSIPTSSTTQDDEAEDEDEDEDEEEEEDDDDPAGTAVDHTLLPEYASDEEVDSAAGAVVE
ncbi:hypothetical protein EV360DRAFT_90790 [Lentinula raphanica]|nr:hypothetical protein EV360DRAFT_90790 [Lentinula raphanica]